MKRCVCCDITQEDYEDTKRKYPDIVKGDGFFEIPGFENRTFCLCGWCINAAASHFRDSVREHQELCDAMEKMRRIREILDRPVEITPDVVDCIPEYLAYFPEKEE
jgi:hypothetical protein